MLICGLCGAIFDATAEGPDPLAPESPIFGPVCWDCHQAGFSFGPLAEEIASRRERQTYRDRADQGFARRKDYEQDDPDRYPWPVEEG